MQVCPVTLVVLLLVGDLTLMSCGICDTVDGTFICTFVPESFPSGISSVVLIVNNTREINSTVFSSDSLASVSSLTMTNAGITAIHAKALHCFTQLKRLNLNQNNLSEICPCWFLHPGLIEFLTLFGNKLKAVNISTLQNFTGLMNLNLSHNAIHTISTASFKSQRNLRHLDLSFNKLTYINPEVFQSVRSARVRLGHNPWDCSCEAQDFIQFVKELVDVSHLERKSEMLCETPSHLKGQLVWKVSECLPPSLPSQSEDELPLTKRPNLIHVIVPLCALVCAACLLTVLCRQKWCRKRIKPGQKADAERATLEAQRWPAKSREGRAPSQLCRSSWPGTRAKSACAVICTGDFNQHAGARENQNVLGRPGMCTDHHGDSLRAAEMFTSEQQKSGHQGTEIQSSGTLREDSGKKNQVSDSTEKLPYLSIGPDTTRQSPEPAEHYHTKQVNGRPIRRMSTWPPTSLQWKKQQTTKKEDLNFSSQQTDYPEYDLKYGVDQCDQTDFLERFQNEFGCTVDKPPKGGNREALFDSNYWPRIEADTHKDKEDAQSYEVVQSLNTGCQIQPAHVGISQLQSNQNQDKWKVVRGFQGYPKTQGGKKRSRAKQEPSKRRGEESLDHPGGSSVRSSSTQSSPADKNLLQNNEYAFINLLHEVVQNQGRWTRDRWKQTHLNKQKIKQRNQAP